MFQDVACKGKCPCDDEPCACPEDDSPVCGGDGDTYKNKCEAECAGVVCNVVHCAFLYKTAYDFKL